VGTGGRLLRGIPAGWSRALARETRHQSFHGLERFLAGERRRHDVYPPAHEVFAALRLTPHHRVRVVILGQDPYTGAGQAHGLAFSVRRGLPLPRSLRNIFAELAGDLGCPVPMSGSLVPWARQGVLLLNAVLTVRAGRPGSHRGRGWERLTGAIVRTVAAGPRRVVFVLWGHDARRRIGGIDMSRHTVIRGAHPSPMSARRGFFGSRPFSRANAALRAMGEREIRWRLPGRAPRPAAAARRDPRRW
jgi:uracil-DNA glycosylase